MAIYPDLPTSYGADPEPLSMIKIDRAEDGSARVRALGADKVRFSLEHPWIEAADKAALDAFYTANRLLVFDHVSKADGRSYSCVFSRAPRYELAPGARWTAQVEIEEV